MARKHYVIALAAKDFRRILRALPPKLRKEFTYQAAHRNLVRDREALDLAVDELEKFDTREAKRAVLTLSMMSENFHGDSLAGFEK